jgi:tRNA threonylcarbamoyladenosine modification (KEOPS) complex Cgi121 subunit
LGIALSNFSESALASPVAIDTQIRLASMRQIHGAIEHLERGDIECAITLAAAVEGMLPERGKPYFR